MDASNAVNIVTDMFAGLLAQQMYIWAVTAPIKLF